MTVFTCSPCGLEARMLPGSNSFVHVDGSMACTDEEGNAHIASVLGDGETPVCDFCRETPVVATVWAPGVELDTWDAYGKQCRIIQSPDWAACSTCANLVEADRWDDLELMVTSRILAACLPDFSEEVRTGAMTFASLCINGVHRAFERVERDA